MIPTTFRLSTALTLAFCVLTGTATAQAPATQPATQPDTPAILIDGDHADWAPRPRTELLAADAQHVYLRFRFSRSRTLLRHGETVVLDLDTDNNRDTGSTATRNRHTDPGVDLRIELNPPRNRNDRRAPAIRVTRFDADGKPIELDPAAINIHTAPTHASETFEVRFDRSLDSAADQPAAIGLLSEEPAELRAFLWRQHHESGRAAGLAKAAAPLPPFAAPEPANPDPDADTPTLTIPTKPDNAIRVVAWNTLWGTQLNNPTPFGRVAQALDADVYLIQEWSDKPYPASSVADWFNQHNPSPPDATRPAWKAVTTEHDNRGSGIAIVSRFPILATGPAKMRINSRTRWTFPVRFAAVVLDTPLGPGVFGTVHHKAGGRLGSQEDRRRLEEAAGINAVLARLASRHKAAFTVFGGDFNMNGTPRVMDTAVRRLDTDRSALIPAAATVLDDPGVLYTHRGRDLRRRLDYITFSDAALTPVNAFVLNTAILPPPPHNHPPRNQNNTKTTPHHPRRRDHVPNKNTH
ncbi:MAG: hypothetical protein AAF797_04685 [Planctomycetota bacterium]